MGSEYGNQMSRVNQDYVKTTWLPLFIVVLYARVSVGIKLVLQTPPPSLPPSPSALLGHSNLDFLFHDTISRPPRTFLPVQHHISNLQLNLDFRTSKPSLLPSFPSIPVLISIHPSTPPCTKKMSTTTTLISCIPNPQATPLRPTATSVSVLKAYARSISPTTHNAQMYLPTAGKTIVPGCVYALVLYRIVQIDGHGQVLTCG